MTSNRRVVDTDVSTTGALVAEPMEITDEHSTSPAFGPDPSPSPDGESRTADGSDTSGAGTASDVSSDPAGDSSIESADAIERGVVHICKRCMTSRSDPDGECPECGDPLLPIRSNSDSYLGQTVGDKYKLVEQIGSGGMGEVYLGVNEPLDQRVAVKFLSEQYTDNEQVIVRFLNEARSYCRVSHPNAVTLLDYGQHDDGSLYIITEYVDGLSLADAIDEHGALSAEQALSIVAQCCNVLAAAHGEQIIHRDLKPDNLMLIPASQEQYAVKVLDFGIAKIVDDDGTALTETGSVFGTPEFMSPEQAEGKPADPRSDVYALGIILYYASTARLPFDGESQYSVLEKQIHDDPPRPSEVRDDIVVHPEIEAVIARCLQKDRADRYQSAKELLAALREANAAIEQGTYTHGKSEPARSNSEPESVNLTRIIEDSADMGTRAYPAGEPEIDSRADTASGSGAGQIDPDRFGVGGELRSVDLSREEPREKGLTVPDSGPDPWRRVGFAIATALLAAVAGWQLWPWLSSVGEATSAVAGGPTSEAERRASRELAAAHAALDEASTQRARKRIQRAMSAVPRGERSKYLSDLLTTTQNRMKEILGTSDEFRRAVKETRCERAGRIGKQLVAEAPDAAALVARRLNACAEAKGDGEYADTEVTGADLREASGDAEPQPADSEKHSEEEDGETGSEGGPESGDGEGARAAREEPAEESREDSGESIAGAPSGRDGESGGRPASDEGEGPENSAETSNGDGATPGESSPGPSEKGEARVEKKEGADETTKSAANSEQSAESGTDDAPAAGESGDASEESGPVDGTEKAAADDGTEREAANNEESPAQDAHEPPETESNEGAETDGPDSEQESELPQGMARPPDKL